MHNNIIVNAVERLTPSRVRLSWQSPAQSQEVKIYLSDSADIKNAEKTILTQTTQSSIDLDILDDKRCYFILDINGQNYVTAERVLPLEGANNFRDIGGYRTGDGKTVRWGNLYRSDHLHNLTDKDIAYLNTANFHTIIDYRNEKEYSKQPNRLWNNQLNTLRLIPDASSAELAAKASNDHEKIQELISLSQSKNGKMVIDGSGLIMQEQNRDFIRNPETAKIYRELVDIILDSRNLAIVQHCRGGKDRTGFGIAIILAILGVDEQTILLDYAMTSELRYSRNMRRMEKYKKETDNAEILAFLYSMMEARSSYLEAAFDEMRIRFGSITGYLTKALKITESEREKIKQNYLY